MPEEYEPREYWSARLADSFNLQGTGHHSYSEAYNRWLYRAKRRALRRALVGVPSGARVLDVGSGVGWVVRQLVELGLRPDGCDIAPPAVERLSAQFPTLAFHLVALGEDRLPIDDATFSAVTMLDVAYHITDDGRWEAALRELARVTKGGATLVVSDALGPERRSPQPHVTFRSLDDWRKAASKAGFEVQSVEPYFSWLSRSRQARAFGWMPDSLRGAVEYALERVAPRTPHMRIARLVRT
jgi:SAM-dependent methyltransferase